MICEPSCITESVGKSRGTPLSTPPYVTTSELGVHVLLHEELKLLL